MKEIGKTHSCLGHRNNRGYEQSLTFPPPPLGWAWPILLDYKDEGGGDIHYYNLHGVNYNWTSNMFELVKRADETQPGRKLGLANGLAKAIQMMPARSHSSHAQRIGEVQFVTPQDLAGALGEQGTTPVSELKKDKIPEGEDITVRPPKHYSTTFKI